MMALLTIANIQHKLATVNWAALPKPTQNKGERGQLLELALGIPNNSDLLDLDDGELKTYTVGQTIAVTQLKHCLPDILETKIPFEQSKVDIYVRFDNTRVVINIFMVCR